MHCINRKHVLPEVAGDLFDAQEWRHLVDRLGLTDRQAEVLDRILRGQPDAQIASSLGISTPTVRTHLQRMFESFGVSDRTMLVVFVFKAFRMSSN